MRIDTETEQQLAEAPQYAKGAVILTALAVTVDGACSWQLEEAGRETSSSSSGPAVDPVVLAGPFTHDAAGRGVVLPFNPHGWTLPSLVGIRLVVLTGSGRVSGCCSVQNMRV